jgi:pimeloyl-ACP methyl ester carboxylesterase
MNTISYQQQVQEQIQDRLGAIFSVALFAVVMLSQHNSLKAQSANNSTLPRIQHQKSMSSYQSRIPVMAGITARYITTKRIATRVLFSGDDNANTAQAVLFLHGNLSSATWWEETMLALPKGFRGIAPDQRGFGEADTSKYVDATRGLGDLADDVIALMDELGIAKAHVVGNSLGGNVIWRLMMDYPQRLLSVTLDAAGSPYGFGGTKDVQGTPCFPDFAGAGAGLANKVLLQSIAKGDRSLDNAFTPRSVIRLLCKQPFVAKREEELLSSMLSVHLGDKAMPGDVASSPNWTGFAPGKWGVVNAISGKYAGNVENIVRANGTAPKPPVLWVRGSADWAVSNAAASDAGTLGMRGVLPNYPGKDIFPPQPMIDQIRAVLERYKAAGGLYEELVLDCGHVPHLEKPEEFNAAFHALLRRVGR